MARNILQDSRPHRDGRRPRPVALVSIALAALVATACSGGGGGAPPSGGGGPKKKGPGGEAPNGVDLDFLTRKGDGFGPGALTDAAFHDLNDDGLVDVVRLDAQKSEVQIGLTQPDGTFLVAQVLETPKQPLALVLADVNGDGQSDLVVSSGAPVPPGSPSDFSLSLYERDAGGLFPVDPTAEASQADAAVQIVAVPGAGPGSDLLVGIPAVGALHRYSLQGAGNLVLVGSLDGGALGPILPFTAALIDAGGDGIDDLVVGDADALLLYPGDGAGGFLEPQLIAANLELPIACCVADVDGNGLEDLTVAQLDADAALLVRNNPTGLDQIDVIALAGRPSSITITDLDADGLVDLAATLYDQNAIEVRFGDAPLSFPEGRVYDAGAVPRDIAAILLPGDDLPDLVCATVGEVSVLENRGERAFHAARGYVLADEPYFLRCVDLDGDTFPDVVSVDAFQRALVFARGSAEGDFEQVGEVPLEPTSTEIPSYVLIEDFDEDGLLDILTSVYETGEVQLLRNGGSLPFDLPSPSDRTTVGSGPLGLAAAELTGDSHLDVLVANAGDLTIQVLRGEADGAFTALTPVSVPYRPIAVALEDLDGDGQLDAVVTTGSQAHTNMNVLVLAGDGAGGFTAEAEYPLDGIAPVIACGDVDGDDRIDVAIAQAGSLVDSVVLLRNQGDFGFLDERLQVGLDPATLELCDANLDDHLDLLVALGSGRLVVLAGAGDGTFATPDTVPTGGYPIPGGITSSAWRDVDGDEQPDLLLTGPPTPRLWVVQNASEPSAQP